MILYLACHYINNYDVPVRTFLEKETTREKSEDKDRILVNRQTKKDYIMYHNYKFAVLLKNGSF